MAIMDVVLDVVVGVAEDVVVDAEVVDVEMVEGVLADVVVAVVAVVRQHPTPYTAWPPPRSVCARCVCEALRCCWWW